LEEYITRFFRAEEYAKGAEAVSNFRGYGRKTLVISGTYIVRI
jgi:hypothetical protein